MWPWFIPRNRAEALDLWISVTNVFARIGGFWAQERKFLRFLEGVPPRARHGGSAAPAVVVVRPWWGSPEPWFMMTLALLIEQRYGNAQVLFDDAAINWADYPHAIENLIMRHALGRFRVGWCRLSDFSGENPLSDEEINKVARFDAMKGHRGESWSPRQLAHVQRVDRPLRLAAGRFDAFLREVRPRYVAVLTGFQATGALLPRLGPRHHIRIATLDGNQGCRLLNVDGIAAHLTDLPRADEMLSPLEPWAIEQAQQLWKQRSESQDPYRYQSVPTQGKTGEPVGVLLPLNQSYDTSALDRSRLFTGQNQWLRETVAWLLENTDEPISIRQHPVERLYPGKDDYPGRLRDWFGEQPRIRVHGCDAPVNTYDLVRRARVVLPHTSSVGLEAIAMGRPVVVEARSFYDELLPKPASKTEYFELIRKALAGGAPLSEAAPRRAWEIYFLSQVCCYLPTILTGYPDDFAKWVRDPFATLAARPDVAMVVEALETNVPLPVLRYRQLRPEPASDARRAAPP